MSTCRTIKTEEEKRRSTGGQRHCGKVTRDYELEHIIPLSAGGPNTLSNITVACAQCNRSKRAKNLLDWRELDDVTHLIAQIASRKGVPIAEVLEDFKMQEAKDGEI